MYYGKKKVIIISIIVAIVAIALVLGGLYVVLATDLFKPTNTMFLKYANMQYEELKSLKNSQAQEIMEARTKMSYESNALIEIEDNSQDNVNSKPVKIDFVSKKDAKNDKNYLNLKASYADNNLLDISYAKSNNIIALQWEEVVKEYFVGVKNENLQEFVKKLGITDTSMIPNKIDMVNYLDLVNITKEEKDNISKTYLNVIIDNIPEQNYTKLKDSAVVKNNTTYNTVAYRLDLSAEEIRNIEIKLLETLKEDSITLNVIATKAKLLGLGEEYTQINNLVKQIDNLIRNMKDKVVDSSTGLSITLYEYKGRVLQTEIIIKNNIKITIDSNYESEIGKVNILLNNLSNEQDFNTVIIGITQKQLENSISQSINMNIDNKQKILLNKTSTGSVSSGVNDSIDIIIENGQNQSISISYKDQVKFGNLQEEIIDLEHNNNCIVLNNYNDEQLQSLINKIANRIIYVVGEKAQQIMQIINNVDRKVNQNSTI